MSLLANKYARSSIHAGRGLRSVQWLSDELKKERPGYNERRVRGLANRSGHRGGDPEIAVEIQGLTAIESPEVDPQSHGRMADSLGL